MILGLVGSMGVVRRWDIKTGDLWLFWMYFRGRISGLVIDWGLYGRGLGIGYRDWRQIGGCFGRGSGVGFRDWWQTGVCFEPPLLSGAAIS